MATFGEVLASRSGLSGVTVREHLQEIEAIPSMLSAADVALMTNSVWSRVIESTLTAEQIQRILLAGVAGKRQGLGTATEEYMGQDGVTPRITFVPTDAAGNGTPVVDGS